MKSYEVEIRKPDGSLYKKVIVAESHSEAYDKAASMYPGTILSTVVI